MTSRRLFAVIERPDCSLADLGLTLVEGRSLLVEVQVDGVAPTALTSAVLSGANTI